MFSIARNCSSRMYRHIRPIIFFGADIFSFMPLNICPSYSYERKRKYIKENIPGREFQESHENFPANFKRKVARIERLEDLKIKIF